MNDGTAPRLERSCGAAAADWIRIAPSCRGFERIEASFSGHGFDPHRHDTYAIGFTLHGVQSFRYRGAAEHSVPGQLFVLHPDEIHDGHAGTSAGFRYRIALRRARRHQRRAGRGALHPPLRARDGIERRTPRRRDHAGAGRSRRCRWRTCSATRSSSTSPTRLAAADPSIARRRLPARHWRAVAKAREVLDANLRAGVASAELEAVTGLTRYALARHFRACLGTSPYRYLVMRRLDRARTLIRQGAPLVEAALASGFADQSHMNRHFKKAYGLSPGRWAALMESPRRQPHLTEAKSAS